jgi:uncharacterized damage-inducible protein DinB
MHKNREGLAYFGWIFYEHTMNKPLTEEFPTFYKNYVDLVTQADGLVALRDSRDALKRFLSTLSNERGTYRYADGKWSINEVLVHLCDAELVFAYRALRIARSDKTALPGYDQDLFVANSYADYRSLDDIRQTFNATRALTIALFESFNEQSLALTGTANNGSISVRAIGYIISGHTYHHLNILKTRYA